MFTNIASNRWLVSLTVLSALGNAGLSALVVYDIFTPSTYCYYYTCLAFPVMSILIVIGLAFALKQRQTKFSALPFGISFFSVILAFWLTSSAPKNDSFFQWQQKQYDHAASQILIGELKPNAYGRVALPNTLAFLSTTGDAVIQKDGVGISIFFEVDNEDGYSWGFLYLSEIRLAQGKANCRRWHDFNPRVENWIFCEEYSR